MTPSPINLKPPGQPVRLFRELGSALQNALYDEIHGRARYLGKRDLLNGIQPENNQNLLAAAMKGTR